MEDIQYNKRNLHIIGAGGLGRELLSWLMFDNEFLKNYRIKGFLDDNLNALEGFKCDIEVVGKNDIENLSNSENLIMAVADVPIKKLITERINEISSTKLISYKFGNTLIGSHTVMGKGIVLYPSVIVSCNVQLGNGVFINSGSQIGHDVIIGNYVSIMANVDIGGGTIIEDEVFIGSGVVVLPGITIAKGTRIGAGSVVVKSIKKVGSYFGNPAQRFF